MRSGTTMWLRLLRKTDERVWIQDKENTDLSGGSCER